MAKLFKLPLISFIACALTIGGIFGAWTFSGGRSAGVDSNLTAGTTPTDYWQFNSVSFKFVCDNTNNNPTLTGTFSDSSTIKTISVHEDAGLTYEQYSGIGKPTCATDGYMFSHWAYYKEGNLTHYNLDVGFNTNVTLYAQYVPTTNPAIYLYTSEGFVLQSYMFRNPSNDNEYIANNLLVSENPGTRNGDGSIKEGRDKYVVKKSGGVPSGTSDSDIVWLDDANSNDKVVRGLYNVFYSPTASSNPDWITFGSHCWFQRQYSLSLFGNPCKGWESELGINAPLGFVSETETEINDAPTEGNPYSDTKITTYKATKVVFTSEAWLEGVSDYQFKPGDRHFEDIRYPKDDISTYTNNYIEAQTSGSKNYELKDNEQRNNMFDITIEVTYKKYASNYDTAQYRNFVLCSAHIVEVVPYNYTINYYATKDSEDPVDSESVAYGSNASKFLSDELNHNQEDIDGGSIDFVTTWIDKYTGQQFDINTLKEKEITQNLNLYPLYESFDPITINYKTYNGSWVTSQTAYVYNCDPNYTNYYAANVNLTASNYDGYTYKSKWQTELTLKGTQYTPTEAGSFDYADISSLAVDGVVNVFARYEKAGVNALTIPNNDPIPIEANKNKIIFTDVSSASETFSVGSASYFMGLDGPAYLSGDLSTKEIGSTGTVAFNINRGDVQVINYSEKKVPSSTTKDTEHIYLDLNDFTVWDMSSSYVKATFDYSGDVRLMEDNDGDGVYRSSRPTSIYQGVKFTCYRSSDDTKLYETTIFSNFANNNYNKLKFTGTDGNWPSQSWSNYYIEAGSYYPTWKDSYKNTTYSAIYLNPGVWDVDNAWFFAYFFNNSGSNIALPMIEIGISGVYVCPNVLNLPSIIFCRMNHKYSTFSWNSDSQNDHVWNQTADITIPTNGNNYCTITGWNSGNYSWSTY